MPVNDGHPHGQGRSAHHLLIQKWHYCPISCCAKCDLSIFPKPNHYPPHALLVCRLLLTVHWYDHSEDTQSSIVELYLSPPANQNLFPIFFPCKHPVYLSLIHISEPTRQAEISYAVFCLKKKKKK